MSGHVLNLRGVDLGKGFAVSANSVPANIPLYEFPPAPVPVKQQIYDVVYFHGAWITRSEIAKKLGRKNTSALFTHLQQLVRDGYLMTHHAQGRNHLGVIYYAPSGAKP